MVSLFHLWENSNSLNYFTESAGATTESAAAASAALSEDLQENIDTLNTTASNKTNFFIFFLINNKTISFSFKNDAKLI